MSISFLPDTNSGDNTMIKYRASEEDVRRETV